MLRKGRKVMGFILSIIVSCIAIGAIVLVILSPGKMVPFTDEKGQVIANSLSEKVFTEINGRQMGMIIKSKNISLPVLLFIHGGPGMPEYFLTQDYPTNLEDYFTVVWWDQRGAGLSFDSDIDKAEMNVTQFVEDTIGVTNYLRERFKQDKIYLLAHSWGTFIGIQAAYRAPQLYAAYMAVAQITDQEESERLAYVYMKDYYAKQGNTKMVAKLKKWDYLSEGYGKMRDSAMHQAGIGTMHEMKSVVKDIFMRSLGCKEYTVGEKINLWRGKIFSSKTGLSQEAHTTDLRRYITRLEVPTYFFSGGYDYTVNYMRARDYLRDLAAPVKGFYLFKHSAHSPIFEEAEAFDKIIATDVLQGNNSLSVEK